MKQKERNFLIGIFRAMLSAIALYMTTFLFLVDDAVFFVSSVLIIDGGEVLAVQKFIWSLCLETSDLKC